MNPELLTIKQIKNITKTVIKKHKINDVYFFGSYARGEVASYSDVDICCDNVDLVIIGSAMLDYFKQQI